MNKTIKIASARLAFTHFDTKRLERKKFIVDVFMFLCIVFDKQFMP